MKKLTRREFLADSTLIAGGTFGALALGRGFIAPRTALAAKVHFLETQCGLPENNVKKVLVAYASFCGTTGAVAEAIGQVLCQRGAAVDVRLLKNISDLSPYQAVVIGSATRSSSWRPEAIKFVEMNRVILGRIPVAYFLTCLALYKDTEASHRVAKSYMDPVLKAVPDVKPVDMGFFAGVLDYSRLNLMFRIVMKSKMKKRGVPEGDFRDWDAIRTWAQGLPLGPAGLSAPLRAS